MEPVRACCRSTRATTLRHHAEGSPLPRREQWARQGLSLESLTSRPGIREQYLPTTDVSGRSKKLFDHVVSSGEQRWRHRNAERLRGLEIDGEIELGRLHHWQVSRFLTFENAADI